MNDDIEPSTVVRMRAPLRGETLQLEGTLFAIAIEEWESPGGVSMWIASLHIHHQDDEIW